MLRISRNRRSALLLPALALALTVLTGCGNELMSGTILDRMYSSILQQDRMVTRAKVHLRGDAEEDPLRLEAEATLGRDLVLGLTEESVKLDGYWDGSELTDSRREIRAEDGELYTVYHCDQEGWTRTQRETGEAAVMTMETSFLEMLREYKDIMLVSFPASDSGAGETCEVTVSMNPADGMQLLEDLGAALAPGEGTADYFRADRLGGMAVFVTLGVDRNTMLPKYMLLEGRKNTGWEAVEETDSDQGDNLMGLLSLVDWLTVRQEKFSRMSVRLDFAFPEKDCILIPEEAKKASETPAPPEPEKPDDGLPELPSDALVLMQFRPEERELFSGGKVHVYVVRLWQTARGGLNLDLNLVNNSSQDAVIFTESVAVNHTMIQGPYLYQSVKAEDSQIRTLAIPTLPENGIQEPGAVTVRLSADTALEGEPLISGQVATFVWDHRLRGYRVPANDSAQVLWEDENLRITAYAPVYEQSRMSIPLCLENLTDRTISLESDKMTDERGNYLTSLLNGDLLSTMSFGDLLPGTCLFTSIPLVWDQIDTILTRFPEEVRFRVTAHDFRNLSNLFQTEEMIIDLRTQAPEETEEVPEEDGLTSETEEDIT